ncbi:MAG: metal-sensitive transcriptional regulator [Patescibacteria group bacterium]|jgi:DNA-binding FrmR family transcriptional regulator
MTQTDDTQLVNQLHRIKGQIVGVEKMIEECRSCEDVVMQLMAARSSIERVVLNILSEETDSCVRSKSKEKQKRIKSLVKTLFKYT